jgi:hypothetical protein
VSSPSPKNDSAGIAGKVLKYCFAFSSSFCVGASDAGSSWAEILIVLVPAPTTTPAGAQVRDLGALHARVFIAWLHLVDVTRHRLRLVLHLCHCQKITIVVGANTYRYY